MKPSTVIHAAVHAAITLGATCIATPIRAEPALIEMSALSFDRRERTRIFADGTIIRDVTQPGSAPIHSVQQASPDVFKAAAAIVAADGASTKAEMSKGAVECLVAFTQTLQALPPIAGFDRATDSCPNERLLLLMLHIAKGLPPP